MHSGRPYILCFPQASGFQLLPPSPYTTLLSPIITLVSLLSPLFPTWHHIPINTPLLSQKPLSKGPLLQPVLSSFPKPTWIPPLQGLLSPHGAFFWCLILRKLHKKGKICNVEMLRCEGWHSHFTDKEMKTLEKRSQFLSLCRSSAMELEFKSRWVWHPNSCSTHNGCSPVSLSLTHSNLLVPQQNGSGESYGDS